MTKPKNKNKEFRALNDEELKSAAGGQVITAFMSFGSWGLLMVADETSHKVLEIKTKKQSSAG